MTTLPKVPSPAADAAGVDYRADSKPYRPSNGTEGEGFEARWCQRCANDDYEGGVYCEILGAAMANEQPAEWVYRNRQPCCTAFVSFDGMQPKPEPRCPLTREMF